MIEAIGSSSETEEFEDIVNKIKETIFTPKMVDIFELTFAYDTNNGNFFNRTLFTDFAGLSSQDSKEKLFSTTNSLLQIKKMYIQQARNELLQLSKIEGKSDILLGTLNYVEKIIDMTVLGLPFEVEKVGYPLTLSSQEIEERTQKMESIEKDLFGGNIRENPLEVVNCYRSLKTKIEKKLPTMTEDQKKISEKLLGSVKALPAFLDVDGIFENRETDTRTTNYKKVFEDNKELFEKNISRTDYVRIFELVFAMYGINKPITIDERNSIYDGDDALYIPQNKSYDILSLQKILVLIQHEIERHMLSLVNNEENVGGFRGANNLFVEEGSAIIMEGILQGKSLSEYEGISVSLPNLLAGELLNGDEYKEFLGIFSQKDIDRKKRLYPLHQRGVQHKDTTYTRGPKAVIEYLAQGGDPKDLFIGRLQTQDIPKISEKKNIKYPKLVSEVLIQKLVNKKINDSEFKEFIAGKYNFLTEKTVKDKMNDFTNDQKRKLVEILNIIKK
ncbi:MAG: hypothetical protein NT085_03250 [candidate division SR1 bacterium]|nr:hypothetical protein [candidate division SR1 bacterium]